MPGRRCSSSMSRTRGSGSDKLELHAGRQHLAHLLRHPLVCLALRVVDRGDDQVLQHLDVVARHDLGIDLERLNLLGAVDHDGHHAAAGVALDAQLGGLLLQPLLRLLRLLHDLLDIHSFSTSRISAGKISSIVWTPASAIACSRSADFFSAVRFSAAAWASLLPAWFAGTGAAPALAAAAPDAGPSVWTMVTVIRRPETCCAADSSHGRCC